MTGWPSAESCYCFSGDSRADLVSQFRSALGGPLGDRWLTDVTWLELAKARWRLRSSSFHSALAGNGKRPPGMVFPAPLCSQVYSFSAGLTQVHPSMFCRTRALQRQGPGPGEKLRLPPVLCPGLPGHTTHCPRASALPAHWGQDTNCPHQKKHVMVMSSQSQGSQSSQCSV